MTFMKSFQANGVAQSDEKIQCTESITINAVEYFRGYLSYLPNKSIGGNSDPDYGIWTAASKGGSRVNVLTGFVSGQTGSGGLPTSDPGEIAVDVQNGQVYSLSSRTVYAYYLGHGPVRHFTNTIQFHTSRILTVGSSHEIYRMNPAQFRQIAHIEFYGTEVDTLLNMSSDCTFTLKNATSGGDEETFIIDKTGNLYQPFTLSNPIKGTPGSLLIIDTANGRNLANFNLSLYGL